MSENYIGLSDERVMQLAVGLESRQRPRMLHDYIRLVRDYCDGADVIDIPQSHRTLAGGENHEGGQRLNARIRQGAAWLASGQVHFDVTPGSIEFREQAELMEKFARAGERRLMRGTTLHNWKRESARDMFECGVSIIQQHSRRDFYVKAQRDRSLLTRGARIEDVVFTRRVDPLHFFWDEDHDGEFGATMIKGYREVAEVARMTNDINGLRSTFAFAESLPDDGFYAGGESVETKELWLPDRGVLIYSAKGGKGKGSRLAEDDPRRIIASWRNITGTIPHFMAAASPWPYTSPLDEMVSLTGSRNWWATMQDKQAAGAIFRHWQLKDTNTGESVPVSLWSQPVPETVLLDLTQPPPNMGPGTEWVLAPFEMHDVLPRYQSIVMQHESAGAAVARLMGQAINQNTAVGTADMMEEYAQREMADVLSATQDQTSRRWEDTYRLIRLLHTKEPVVAAERRRDTNPDSTRMGKFYSIALELRGEDIVAEDVQTKLDMRGLMRLAADYRLGREMQNNGDISYERRVEQGLVPFVDDADEEVADIFLSQIEKIGLEAEAEAFYNETQENLGGAPAQPMAPMPRPNVTRGARSDPRGTGVGAGANNVSDTALNGNANEIVARGAA